MRDEFNRRQAINNMWLEFLLLLLVVILIIMGGAAILNWRWS